MINVIFNELREITVKSLDGLANFINNLSREKQKEIDEYGGLGTLIIDMFKIKNQNSETLSLQEVIAWLKAHLPKDMRCRACMTVLDSRFIIPQDVSFKFHYYVCFLNEDGDILFDKSQIMFHCNVIDAELQQSFNGKNMIVFN